MKKVITLTAMISAMATASFAGNLNKVETNDVENVFDAAADDDGLILPLVIGGAVVGAAVLAAGGGDDTVATTTGVED